MRRALPLVVLLALAVLPAAASAAPSRSSDVQRLSFRSGPIHIEPGQNTIAIDGRNVPRPRVPGFITRFSPNLEYTNGKVPRVDVLHLHHGVWLVNGELQFAAGEEKTIFSTPAGFGWPSRPGDRWVLNHMIHNLLPNPDDVYLTWTVDFVPLSSPTGQRMRAVRTKWLDVEAGRGYPVFDVRRGSGKRGRFTYPDEASRAYGAGAPRNRLTVPHDGVLVGTAGHLHPGGLWTDLKLTRSGRTVNLFRSKARYWEPAGAVSWDVAMTHTGPDWKVAVKQGDVLSVSATYDSKRASWYESMGIMPVAMADGAGGVDPFSGKLDRRGRITHGRLPENRVHGGKPTGQADARRLPAGPTFGATGRGALGIRDFLYGQGDLNTTGAQRRPAVVKAGQSLPFVNADADRDIYHTVTACRAPCNRSTGIAYPLADGEVDFDSGELGFGPPGLTAAANRDRWDTPASLKAGTYTYFCRVHPFMRGAFRVER